MIRCEAFEEMLDRFLSGDLTASERREAQEHAAGCARCHELLLAATGDAEVGEATGDETLTAAILRRTSGSACGRAEALLCDWVDGRLEGLDAELVSQHVDHCSACAGLAEALTLLKIDLPAMAEIDPGPLFVRDVMNATVHLAERKVGHASTLRIDGRTAGRAPGWESSVAAARPAAAWWTRLLTRPRITLELAYSGAMLIFLLAGTPVSPLRDIPARGLAVLRVNPVGDLGSAWQGRSLIAGRVVSTVTGARRLVGGPLATEVGDAWRGLKLTGGDAVAAVSIMSGHSDAFWGAVARLDLIEAGKIVGRVKEELRDRSRRPAAEPGQKNDRTPGGRAP